jgi:hypothetical protein
VSDRGHHLTQRSCGDYGPAVYTGPLRPREDMPQHIRDQFAARDELRDRLHAAGIYANAWERPGALDEKI